MNNLNIFLFLFLSTLNRASCSEDENCLWAYKCCEFKEMNSGMTCSRLCEAEVNCRAQLEEKLEDTTRGSIEAKTEGTVATTTEPTTQEPIQKAKPFQIINVVTCRVGYKLDSRGRCRKNY